MQVSFQRLIVALILQFFYKQPVVPVDGYVTVPTGPGMGVELDESKIASEMTFSGAPVSVERARAAGVVGLIVTLDWSFVGQTATLALLGAYAMDPMGDGRPLSEAVRRAVVAA